MVRPSTLFKLRNWLIYVVLMAGDTALALSKYIHSGLTNPNTSYTLWSTEDLAPCSNDPGDVTEASGYAGPQSSGYGRLV